ncbi:MAG: methyltransferase domain-containing protein [Solirubrobacterales bacterium]|nr:methyltransferase domain-containing protein [Solirubrobacterales bacterium]
MSVTTATLTERVAERSWYHTLDLAPGVVTPGFFDTRPTVAHVPLPADLTGLRCLDVGTWDGFWAFEMERRGAASVTAIDIEDPERWDWPPQARFGETNEARLAYLRTFKSGASSFALAREVLGSQVERVDCSVYDLDPDVHGRFDLVFMGSLLLHLRDPVRALDRVRAVCSGEAVLAESIELFSTLARPRTATARLEGLDQSWWWQPNAAGFRRMVRSAGFRIEEQTGLYFLPTGAAHPRPPLHTAWRELATSGGRERIVTRVKGIPHTAVRAVPLG